MTSDGLTTLPDIVTESNTQFDNRLADPNQITSVLEAFNFNLLEAIQS
jgi:hypothetical protein